MGQVATNQDSGVTAQPSATSIPLGNTPTQGAALQDNENTLGGTGGTPLNTTAVRNRVAGAIGLGVSSYTELEGMEPSTKVQSKAGLYSVAARFENFQSTARLRGAIEAKPGETLAENAVAFTLPAALRPAHELLISGGRSPGATSTLIKITAAGAVSFNAALTPGNAVWLDGVTWTIG